MTHTNWTAELARPRKISLSVRGHRTSVTLEPAIWQCLQRMAAADGTTPSALAARIDTERSTDVGLATALRTYVVCRLRDGEPRP